MSEKKVSNKYYCIYTTLSLPMSLVTQQIVTLILNVKVLLNKVVYYCNESVLLFASKLILINARKRNQQQNLRDSIEELVFHDFSFSVTRVSHLEVMCSLHTCACGSFYGRST